MSEPQQATPPLKPRMTFSDAPLGPEAAGLTPTLTFDAQAATQFTEHAPEPQSEADQEDEASRIVTQALRPRRSLWRRMLSAGIALFALSVLAQGAQTLYRAWQQHDWIALGAVAAASLMVCAGIGALAVEWRRLYQLRQRAQTRDRARELLASHHHGEARAFCEQLARQAGLADGHPALLRWQAALHETHNDREVTMLYAQAVQPVLDARARQEISQSAAQAALMIAVSPLALVDMAFIAWRNLRLVNRIAQLYGIELGYFSRLTLFRLVLLNVAFAGASELVREIGMDWMSQDLAARLSARAAQGLGTGLLTARLGIRAMELCRPLPWLDDKPRLGDFRHELLNLVRVRPSAPGQES
ncbi:YcjF family protein [Dickeya lacustris]|uniref:UPF0283 membrane protein O1Q98_03715 n=1 Tax=Dickeya lacustris TaxID=2259638 RepID=A0ABY8G8Y2_9GAMM|nr:TIGR01620 family protein [Dickeya lacustris]WFN56418.1 TIGR01620 family protein [Dickeya lacustris]